MRIILATAILGWLVATASAQTCEGDLTGRNDNCTANDVTIAMLQVRPNGVIHPCAFVGDTAIVNVQATLVAGAAARFDIGIFIAQDGGDARFGSCVHDYLPPPLLPSGQYNPTSGTGPYFQGEPVADNCGDIEQGVNTLRNIDNLNVLCVDTDNDGIVDVGTLLSWDNNTNTVCNSVADTIPGTTAKCRAARIGVVGLPPPPSTTTTSSTSTSTSSSSSSSSSSSTSST